MDLKAAQNKGWRIREAIMSHGRYAGMSVFRQQKISRAGMEKQDQIRHLDRVDSRSNCMLPIQKRGNDNPFLLYDRPRDFH